ncbi:DISARM system phospholipase D-like protein DrmC [Gloeobacter kilaueensis]|uniref:Phosphatidylserine/phosphatidylglycerophosphate/ cardiolipin synthases-related enzyme n=1 Tax=Gloeobacter kilaueensis (strain ATCC BAA-2537 / CCAP 1431/1 / ULC 316 / JS1) TaxID=1183438 RepID=U5QDI1_GLOK1|nr:DISARM system phospholipase D-like protein DrmC [Gloeobacter kilaueensis]AGY56946.1 Phosphatidylserine/phosphatidylglycerophosphate/cardiolipin synthases-related enzyme [Gloeobacter kilaueensis JS1]
MNPAVLRGLSRTNLEALAAALESGRIVPPYSRLGLQALVGALQAEPAAAEMAHLAAQGMQPIHIAYLLRALVAERADAQQLRDQIEIVWTGDDLLAITGRDTAVVVRELFAAARKSVLIASYALDRGEKAMALFGELAARLDNEPGFTVRVCLNIHRPTQSNQSEAQLVEAFGKLFREEIWPGSKLPQVFYDPRALQKGGNERACLHAKCVVIDQQKALVTSANFTEAAHKRNIEVGALLSDQATASALWQQFALLIQKRNLLALYPV